MLVATSIIEKKNRKPIETDLQREVNVELQLEEPKKKKSEKLQKREEMTLV